MLQPAKGMSQPTIHNGDDPALAPAPQPQPRLRIPSASTSAATAALPQATTSMSCCHWPLLLLSVDAIATVAAATTAAPVPSAALAASVSATIHHLSVSTAYWSKCVPFRVLISLLLPVVHPFCHLSSSRLMSPPASKVTCYLIDGISARHPLHVKFGSCQLVNYCPHGAGQVRRGAGRGRAGSGGIAS